MVIVSDHPPNSARLSASAAVALAQKLANAALDDQSPTTAQDDSNAVAAASAFFDAAASTLDEPTHASTKNKYVDPSPDEFENLVRTIRDRLVDGQGEALFEIGVEEDGSSMDMTPEEFENAEKVLTRAAAALSADSTILHKRTTLHLPTTSSAVSEEDLSATSADGPPSSPTSSQALPPPPAQTSPFEYGHVLVRRKNTKVEDILELRVAVTGNVDAGKSTLLGVLTKDVLDDGRGKARVNLFRHKHEIESGRTSSVGMEILGFDSQGAPVTSGKLGKTKLTWDEICAHSSKVLTFMDLAGHEKYLKTTVFGMTGCAPDFVMLMIGSNAGIIGMTKEHLGLALALQVPVFIVITKIDMCPKNVLDATVKQLVKILKSSGVRKIPMFVRSVGDVLLTAGNFVSERICPIFQVSNVTGDGLSLLRMFLNVLHAKSGKYDSTQAVEYQITDTFSVPGVGTVVSGTVTSGIVHVGDTLLLGPDSNGHFVPTMVKSIQRKRVNVPLASAGHSASFALKKIKRASIRKGMVMLSNKADARAVREFEAEILVLYHSTTIGTKYQAMLHCGCVRQTAKIVGMDRAMLRTGDRALVVFRFMQVPEYVKVGTRLLFREGRTKGVGKVVRLLHEGDTPSFRSIVGNGGGVDTMSETVTPAQDRTPSDGAPVAVPANPHTASPAPVSTQSSHGKKKKR
ncbi:P-loop containing nucleoside triphosphate hydrolase protein [Cladochytrium replicatum]|nr:P-loop containing nucleoside triphosphate hydrolase protein [Cladochytrium replicatum]KAI8800169.1 P-loop containing nucleoside triphosphate hydrolase protein [Cladochytrium replicatum]